MRTTRVAWFDGIELRCRIVAINNGGYGERWEVRGNLQNGDRKNHIFFVLREFGADQELSA